MFVLLRASQAFTFTARKEVLHEIAIVNISGGIGAKFDDATKVASRAAAVDANREELARAALEYLGVPGEQWGEAVSKRPLKLIGQDHPWNVTIASVKSSAVLAPLFGDNLMSQTVATTLRVACVRDGKGNLDGEDHWLEVEIGAVGDGEYRHFRSIGHKGLVLAKDNPSDGYVVTIRMDQNIRHYPYFDTDWQNAAAHYAAKHFKNSQARLARARRARAHVTRRDGPRSQIAGLTPEQAAVVTIEHIATRPICPLNSLVKKQSVKGLETHLLVKGVNFMGTEDAGDGEAVVAQPVPTTGELLSGDLSADGLTPLTAQVLTIDHWPLTIDH